MGPDWLGGALLLPEHRLMLQPLAKCQSTISKCLMVALAGRRPPEALLPGERSLAMAVHSSIHHGLQRFDGLTSEQQQQCLKDESWMRITVVRDPLERLLSFWWQKLVLLDPGYEAFCQSMPCGILDASSVTSLRRGWDLFLGFMQSRPELLEQDHHLVPQAAIASVDQVAYTHIVQRAEFVFFWADYLSTLSADTALAVEALHEYRQFYMPQVDLIRLIAPTRSQKRVVKVLYERDYQWLRRLPAPKGQLAVMAEPMDNHNLIQAWVRQIRDGHRLMAVAASAVPASAPADLAWPDHNRPESGYAEFYGALQRQDYASVLAALDETACIDGEAYYLLGVCYHLQGDQAKALNYFFQSEQLGFSTPYVFFNRGNAFRALGHESDAVVWYHKAIEWFPSFGECQINCALALEKLDQLEDAEKLLRKRLTQDRTDSQAWFVLGNILRRSKRPLEAVEAFRGCLTLRPDHCDALNNLGLGYSDLQQFGQAEMCYIQALSIDARYVHSRRNLAQLLVRMRRHEEALPHYALWELHAQSAPERLVATLGRLSALAELDRCDEALAACKQLTSPAIEFLCRCTVMPILFDDVQQVQAVRERLEGDLERLHHVVFCQELSKDEWNLLYRGLFCVSHFYLAYQLYNDCLFQQKYAAVATQVLTHVVGLSLSTNLPSRPRNTHPRVGFISAHLRRHNGSHWALGWVKALLQAEQPMQLFSYNLGEEEDDVTARFAEISSYRHLPLDFDTLTKVVNLIRADQLDLLVFTDVGMHAPSRVLSYFRLARIQAAAWGHPVTSGSPMMDFYLSGSAMEDDTSPEWYSEQLVTLPGTGLVYPNPALIPGTDNVRQELGLPDETKLLLSLQSTFKYHPAYDPLYVRILENADGATCVLVDHMGHTGLGQKLRIRLASAATHPGEMLERLHVLPRLPHHVYVNLFAVAHHVLDTPGWNGGNSSFQALSMGCPVVTLRGNSMRGRHTVAMLEIIGLPDLIADSIDEYVQISLRLLSDIDFDQYCRNVIEQNSHKLFDDAVAARAFEQWVRTAVAQP